MCDLRLSNIDCRLPGRRILLRQGFAEQEPQAASCFAKASQDRNHKLRSAFTLTELLVVMGVIVLLMALGIPSVRSMLKAEQYRTGINTASAAIAAARAYATQSKGFSIGKYDGAAVIFTPGGECRIVVNDEEFVDGTGSSPNPLEEDVSANRNGYIDAPGIDYVQMHSSVGVVGIARANLSGTDEDVLLLAPPFAVRFDENGQLITGLGSTSSLGHERLVFYNGNYDVRSSGASSYPDYQIIDVSNDYKRGDPFWAPSGTEYNADHWDPRSPSYSPGSGDEPGEDTASGRQRLPFERLETVPAIIVFDLEAFRAEGYSLLAVEKTGYYPINDTAKNWIIENGTPLYINRFTGAVMKEE